MSIAMCPNCGKQYDQDYEVEHEEICEEEQKENKTMKENILELLKKELRVAELKEELSKIDYKKTDTNDLGRYAVNYAHYTKAQGYTNGILEAIDLVIRIKEED